MRVNFKVQRATILDIAGRFLTCHRDFRCLDKLPLATFVVGNVSLDIFLSLSDRYRLLNLENLIFCIMLLGVHVASVTHARVASVTGFLCNHVSLSPVLRFVFIRPVIHMAVTIMVASVHPSDHVGAIFVGDKGTI